MPTETLPLVERVRGILEGKEVSKRIIDVAGLSKGAVVVYLRVNLSHPPGAREWDVYFEADKYRAEYRARGSRGFLIEGTDLHCLAGIIREPPVRSFHEALEFAKENLSPKTPEYQWYDRPIFVD